MAPRPVAAPSCALGYDKPLCASLDGFTLHPATRAGALDPRGREKLLCNVLRPPIAHRRIEHRPEGLVSIALKRAFADGTLAVEMDPLSLLCRLATSVPPPRFHTVKYAGVLAPASTWRARIKPQREPIAQPASAASSRGATGVQMGALAGAPGHLGLALSAFYAPSLFGHADLSPETKKLH